MPQSFKQLTRRMLLGKTLSVEDAADVLSLKDNDRSPEDYVTALQLLARAQVSFQTFPRDNNLETHEQLSSSCLRLVGSPRLRLSGDVYIFMTSMFHKFRFPESSDLFPSLAGYEFNKPPISPTLKSTTDSAILPSVPFSTPSMNHASTFSLLKPEMSLPQKKLHPDGRESLQMRLKHCTGITCGRLRD